jgi:hypothetical protein
MEHSHLIFEPNVTQKRKKNFFWLGTYYNNIFELLEVCPNLTYYTKTFKFINRFQKFIKRKKSQIMNHMKYIYTKNHKNIP